MIPIDDFSHRAETTAAKAAIDEIFGLSEQPLMDQFRRSYTYNVSFNFALDYMRKELELRRVNNESIDKNSKSYISEYADRLERIEGLVDSSVVD